ncbi:hypothetical protein [Listeria grandensis]|uniref:hypothetical protein n=1 Tax=Listeria grandensis TaxID=1494963 RepID=UPI00164CF714|nr:hypothetical protein [Listeria grandensis]MBC6315333.1 hypothetical protein [Listeria grandensis]
MGRIEVGEYVRTDLKLPVVQNVVELDPFAAGLKKFGYEVMGNLALKVAFLSQGRRSQNVSYPRF